MKRILSVILSAVLILSVVMAAPFSASAATKHIYGDWEYEIWTGYNDQTYESYEEICITNYTGSDEKVTIPNEIDGKPVRYLYNNYIFGNVDTAISDNGERHFANHATMTDLTIPANLRYIAGFMLMDCTALHDIHISSNNEYFEFKSGVLYMKDGTKTWGDHVHYHNDDIPNEYGPVFARFSEGVVNLPTKTTTIYAYAFYNHSKLLNVVMTPAVGKMKKIEDYAFYNTGLIGMEDLSGYAAVEIPWGVTEIGYSAFMYCKNIHLVHFPETLKRIGSQAFLETGCLSFYVPDSLEEVGYQAFGYANSKVNIYGSNKAVEIAKAGNNYRSSDYDIPEGSGSGGSGGGGAIMIHHDPDKPWDHFYICSTSVPPTCTTPGLSIYACTCGYLYYGLNTIILPTGHNWTEKKVYSTCFEQGYTLHTCKNCGETYKDNYTKVRNHYKVRIPAVEPTATTAGNTEGLYCDMCGTVFTQSQLIPPTGYTEKESSGVKVTAEPEASPKVKEVTDEATIESLKLDEDKQADKVYDIKLEKDGETVQPEGDVIVKIPCDDEDAVVYHQEEDGTLTDMNAYNDEEGNKVFKTDSFSLFVIASAAPVEYKLWVNNEQITSDHLTVQCGEGEATFDPKTTTLTLNNAQITKGAEIDSLGTGILTFLDEKLTIEVNGDCSITETGGDGIGSYEFDDDYTMVPHDITITGDGSLTIIESTPIYGYGVYCTGSLTIDGADLTIRSEASGIWARSLTVKNDSHILSQCSSRFSGIVINHGSFIMSDSVVDAESVGGSALLLGNDQESSSLMLSSGYLTLRGQLGIQSETDHSRVAVSGGTLTVEGQIAAVSEKISSDTGNIVLGEGVELTSGDFTAPAFVISDGVEPAPKYILGDTDSDGKVTVVDATFIQKKLASLPVTESFNEAAGDVDRSGKLEITDATFIQKYLAKLPAPEGIGKELS